MNEVCQKFVLAKIYAFSVALLIVLGTFGAMSYAQGGKDQGGTVTVTDGNVSGSADVYTTTDEKDIKIPVTVVRPVDNYQQTEAVARMHQDYTEYDNPNFVGKMHQDYTEYDEPGYTVHKTRTRVIWSDSTQKR